MLTWVQLRSIWFGSNMAQLGPNLDPFGRNSGPSWGPQGFKMGDMAGPIRNPQNVRLQWYPMLCLRWPNLLQSCLQTAPSCAMLNDLDLHARHMVSTWYGADRPTGPGDQLTGPGSVTPPGWQGIIGIMRLWSLKIYCKQNETPYALIIPTQQRFTAHMLYKTRLSKNL